MKRKLLSILIMLISIVFLVGCDKSKEIKTIWKIEDAFGNAYKMHIKNKDILIIDGKEEQKLSYEEDKNGSSGNITYYGLKLDGKRYAIIFPDEKNHDKALFIKCDDNKWVDGKLVFAMNKKEKPNYSKYKKEYLE